MENRSPTETLLERIAIALERIVDILAVQESPEMEPPTDSVESSTSAEFEDSEPVFDDLAKLHDFLALRGIAIKTIPLEQESDETLDKLALFIGSRFESVRSILDLIKGNMNAGRPFSLSLKNESQQTVADTTNLCTNLYNIAFLTAYRYQKSPIYQLSATPGTSPQAQNFYSGQWLERFVKTQVVTLLRSRSLRFAYLCNAQISLPNGDDFELDMLFETEGEVFWLEAKTGDYRKHIEKYSKMSKLMGLDRSHTFMILADEAVTDNLAKDLSNLFRMTVVRIEKFAEQLAVVLPKDHDAAISLSA